MDNGIQKVSLINFFLLLIATAIPSFHPCKAQQLTVITSLHTYQQQANKDSDYKMVELKSLAPQSVYDLRYATKNNFTGHKLYKKGNKTFMRQPAARALLLVQNTLLTKGLTLKIFDAYRPYAATKLMWDLIKDERYVANPAKGSGHNRGLAVDLTIVDLKTGKELDMGTGFDNFTDTAHHSFTQLPENVLNNRKMLRTIMEENGFKALETEWWHFYWPNNKNYDVLDIDFKKLQKGF